MKLWVLNALCAFYTDDPQWTFMAVFDSREQAKKEAERVTPGLFWKDDDGRYSSSSADVAPDMMGAFDIRRWIVDECFLNDECNIRSWSDIHA